MNASKFGITLLALVAWAHVASAQVRPIGRVPVSGRVAPASYANAYGGGVTYVGQPYFDDGMAGYGGYGVYHPGDCGGCGACAACVPCGPVARVAVGAVGLAGELLCDVRQVVGCSVSHVVNCLLPCPRPCGPMACAPPCGYDCGGCADCGGGAYAAGYDGLTYDGGMDAGYAPTPAEMPATPAAPAAPATPGTNQPAPPTNPFQDDPVGSAQRAVRRDATQRAVVAGGRASRMQGVNTAAYRGTAPATAQRYRPMHSTQLRRPASTARSAYPAAGAYR